MERKSVSLEEQETSISLSPLDKFAEVYSCEPTVVKRLYKYAEEHPDVCRITMDDGYGVTCEMPKEWIKYKPVAKRVMSEEQRAVTAARLRAMAEAKKKQ